MPIIVTADNVPAALTLIAQRQDEFDARLEALTALCADQAVQQTVRSDAQEEQIRNQAKALRITATQLQRNISDVSKAANSNGNGNHSNRNSSNTNGRQHSGNNGNPGIAGARIGGEANLGPLEAGADVGGRIGTRQSRSQRREAQAAQPPSEPDQPQRRRAHRWV